MIKLFSDASILFKDDTVKASWAFVIVKDNQIIFKDYGNVRTANVAYAELLAFYKGAKKAETLGYTNIQAFTDRRGIVDVFNKLDALAAAGWLGSGGRKIKNKNFWKQIKREITNVDSMKWVRAHNGNHFNEVVDYLSKKESGANIKYKVKTKFKKIYDTSRVC